MIPLDIGKKRVVSSKLKHIKHIELICYKRNNKSEEEILEEGADVLPVGLEREVRRDRTKSPTLSRNFPGLYQIVGAKFGTNQGKSFSVRDFYTLSGESFLGDKILNFSRCIIFAMYEKYKRFCTLAKKLPKGVIPLPVARRFH